MFQKLKVFLGFGPEPAEKASSELKSHLETLAAQIDHVSGRLIDQVQREKAALNDEIDRLTAQMSQKSKEIDLAHDRARWAHELASTIKPVADKSAQ